VKNHHQSLALSQAARSVIEAKLPTALSAAAPSPVPKCQDLAGNVTPPKRISKTNPIPPASRHKSLSPGQLAAISLLLAGYSVAAIARKMATSERTIFRWKRDPRFDAEIRRRAEALGPRLRLSDRQPNPQRDPGAAEVRREFDAIMTIGRNLAAEHSMHR